MTTATVSWHALSRALAALTVAGIVWFVIGVVIGFAVVGRHGGGPIQHFDTTVWRWSIGHRGDLVGASKVVATVGDAPLWGVICAVSSIVLLAVWRSPRGLVPIVAYIGGEAEVFLIREVIHRHRPPTADYPAPGAVRGIHETSYSFPSGHAVAVTAVLFALFGGMALVRRWWWPWLVALLASLFVMDTRLVLGVHWFSDVVFGFLIGAGWGVTVALVDRGLESRTARRE